MARCCACTAENLIVDDTDSIELALTPGLSTVLTADLRRDPDVTNQLALQVYL